MSRVSQRFTDALEAYIDAVKRMDLETLNTERNRLRNRSLHQATRNFRIALVEDCIAKKAVERIRQ
jgi:hypothetical protein